MDNQNQAQNRFIIGLTGNIGTGKSTVLNMLRHLGAYAIDADILTKKVYEIKTAQREIINRFGEKILGSHGHINRKRLATVVFKDPQALRDLEDIIHPLVSTAVKNLIRSAQLPIIVIEAIKLLDSDLVDLCDSIWVVNADDEIIMHRLIDQRGMDANQVKERLSNQSSASEKIAKADVIINNTGLLQNTWDQVAKNWQALCGENAHFHLFEKNTSTLFSALGNQPIHPFSDAFFRIIRQVENRTSTLLFPSGEQLTKQSLEQFATRSFILSSDNRMDNSYFSIWNLTTFILSCKGFFSTVSANNQPYTYIPITTVGQVADLYQTQQIIIPFHQSLNEENYPLRRNGYSLFSPKSNAFTPWIEAGYNTFNKILWNGSTIFEEDQSI